MRRVNADVVAVMPAALAFGAGGGDDVDHECVPGNQVKGGGDEDKFHIVSEGRQKCQITLTQAQLLGEAVLNANRLHQNPVDMICAREGGKRLFEGKIVDLQRRLEGGFARGEITLEGFGGNAGERGEIAIQNEFLVFRRDGKVEAVVPDLILVLDHDTGHAITTEVLRYGQRCAVVGLPCHPLLRTPAALKVIGPAAFGIADVVYQTLS